MNALILLLHTRDLIAIIVQVDEFESAGGGSNILMGLTVLQKSLTWIVLGALAFALSMMVLRWKKGNFSSRSILIIAFGAVLWTMSTAALRVAIRITDGGGYEYDVTTIMNDWGQTRPRVPMYQHISEKAGSGN